MTETTRRIIDAIRAIPRGRVSSYRDLAFAAELPNGARQVARILHSMSEKYRLPWHRVIRADGSIALESGGGREIQTALLCSEGVAVSESGRVDMARYGLIPAPGRKGPQERPPPRPPRSSRIPDPPRPSPFP
ncbi:MAG: MGMT family protein, partial [Treponema sp.]|nr:MGMT family protein [Treponema sp.]